MQNKLVCSCLILLVYANTSFCDEFTISEDKAKLTEESIEHEFKTALEDMDKGFEDFKKQANDDNIELVKPSQARQAPKTTTTQRTECKDI